MCSSHWAPQLHPKEGAERPRRRGSCSIRTWGKCLKRKQMCSAMRSLFTVPALVPAEGHQQRRAPSSWAHQHWALNLGLQYVPVAPIFSKRDGN